MTKALAVVSALLLCVGVIWLRENTESEHYDTHPASTVTIVVDADTHGAEPTQSVREMTEAQLTLCRLEVNSDPIRAIEQLDDDPTRFRVVLRPALDDTDHVQYQGCVEDWLLDHLRLRIVSYERNGPVSPDEHAHGVVAS